jgi:hypothetical protein
MADQPMAEFNREVLERFKAARDEAIGLGHTAFTFEGNVWLVDYAKYVIEYLESRLAK